VRTGFSEKVLANLLQQTPETQTAVLFFYKSTGRITRKMGAGDCIAVMKRCHWLKPVLVARGQVHGLDPCRPASSTGGPRAAN
jgi:hypothetical protein